MKKKLFALLLSASLTLGMVSPATSLAAESRESISGKVLSSVEQSNVIAQDVVGGEYIDQEASAGEAYEYSITGSDGAEETIMVAADETDDNGVETISTTPEISWERTEDINGNYVSDVSYVNSGGPYTWNGISYDQYTALPWSWSLLRDLVEDKDDRVDDVWSTQTDGASAVKYSVDGHGQSSWDRASVYKIAGTFTWPEDYDLNDTTITLESANDASYSAIYNYINNNGLSELFADGKVIAVNDDVYVVMWVENDDGTGEPTVDNIDNYLLFWTGTSGKGFWTQNGNTGADWNRQTPATFISAGKQGVRAFRDSWPNAVGITTGLGNADVERADGDVLAKITHTDGWYTLTDTSAINSVMRANYGTNGIEVGAKVHLDLYCFNNSGEGIIDELKVGLTTQRETETTVTVRYYYGNVTNPDDREHYLGESVLTNQLYGTSISLQAGTNASQLDYMRAAAIIKAGNQDVSSGTQVNNPLVVTRGEDNIINVLYTAEDAKVIYLTAPSNSVRYDGNSHILNTVTVTESGCVGSAVARGNGKYELPDGNVLENVYSAVDGTDPGKYPNNFTTSDGHTPTYIVRDPNNNDVTGSYTFVKTPGTLTITYEPEQQVYTYDFGVKNKYNNTLNDVETKATITESSDEVEVTGDDVAYTPSAADTGDSVDLTLTFTGNYQVTKNITFVPASNVLYEENLVTVPEDSGWVLTGLTLQDTVVDDNEKTVYGYTNINAFAESKELSNGSAYNAELKLRAGDTTTKTNGAASFTFTGTGFDLISECGTDTGMLLVKVSNSSGNTVKAYLVDTYFTGDDSIIDAADGGILDYQVPVVRNMELEYGTYKVEVYGYLVNTAGAAAAVASYSMSDESAMEYSHSSGVSADDIVVAALDDLGLFDEIDPADVEVSYMSEDSVLNGGYGNTAAAGSGVSTFAMTADVQNNAADSASNVTANVYIDGFRVYKSLENDADIYVADNEDDVKYASVYDYIKTSVTELEEAQSLENAAVYVEYDGETGISNTR